MEHNKDQRKTKIKHKKTASDCALSFISFVSRRTGLLNIFRKIFGRRKHSPRIRNKIVEIPPGRAAVPARILVENFQCPAGRGMLEIINSAIYLSTAIFGVRAAH